MFRKPRFRASFQVYTNPTQLLVVGDQRSYLFDGATFVRVAPLLDGQHHVGQIAVAAAGGDPVTKVYSALHHLEQRGVLVEGDNIPPSHRESLLEGWRRGASSASPPVDGEAQAVGESVVRGRGLKLAVHGLGNASTFRLAEMLVADGHDLGTDDGELLIVVTDDYLRSELAAINQEQLQAGRPWMLVKPSGMIAWIGPVFVPSRTGCWECLAQRLRANRQMEQYIQARRPAGGPLMPSLDCFPAGTDLGNAVACTAVMQWLMMDSMARVEGRLLTLDFARSQLVEHALIHRPQCVACGDAELVRQRASRALQLASHPKRFREDGGHRTRSPAETFRDLQHHISPVLGAVSELVPAIGQRSPLTPCYVAGHNFSMGIESIAFLRESLRGMSGGKGASDIQAKVSGLCEAIERYSGLYRGDESHVLGTLDSLGQDAIHPNACMGFSESQYRARDEWNATQPPSRCLIVPRRFDPAQEIEWTPLWSLTSERVQYLPSAFCYYGHPDFVGRWCSPDSNGSAAGNTLEEAILQGYMELVERDAVAIWWYNRLRRRGVDWDTFGLPYLSAIRDYYATLDREIWALDITSDLGIPAIACVSVLRGAPTEDILVGFGAHFDVRIAMLRAITEVNQFLPSVARRRADGSTMYLFGDELARNWWTTARLVGNEYLLPATDEPFARFTDFPDLSTHDLMLDVHRCVELSRRHGMELLVLDQSQPDIALNVVKVVVPELCHFWRRLGKARMYEVAVAAGWLDRAYAEHEVNPHTIFF